MYPYPAKWPEGILLPSLASFWLLGVDRALFHQTRKLVFYALSAIVCSSLCCHQSVRHTGWEDMLHVWWPKAWWDACLWGGCCSCFQAVAWVLWLVPSRFCETFRHCLVRVACMLVIVGLLCCCPLLELLSSVALSGNLLDLIGWSCCWVLLVRCHIPWGTVGDML